MSLHEGHRNRLRERFLRDGLDGFDEHQVLEMLLFYCLPRKDTNEIAHELIKRFGSLSSVMEASLKELQDVSGLGEQTATFLKFAASFSRYYMVSRSNAPGKCLITSEAWGEHLQPLFLGKTNEIVYLLCLDAKGKQLCCKMINEGSVNTAGIQVRKLVEVALNSNASFAILAHNHPSGVALPSGDDVSTTRTVANALRTVDVILLDHMIFAENDSISLVQSGYFDPKVSYTSF